MKRALQVLASPLIWLTLAYLACELSFSARLLDAAATASTVGDIHALERFGRTLSGIALGLVAAGALLRPDRPSRMGRAYLLASTGLMLVVLAVDLKIGSEHVPLVLAGIGFGACAALQVWLTKKWSIAVGAMALVMHIVMSVAAMFVLQTHLVGAMVGNLGPADRRAAVVLAEAANRVSACQIRVDDIFLCAGAATPSGKTFAAMFPLMALGLPDLDDRVLPVLEKLAAPMFTTECAPERGQCLGTPEHFFNEVWRPLLARVHDDEWTKYKSQVNASWSRGERAWDDYAARLNKRGLKPGTVPPAHWDRVRRELRNDGIKVGDDWRPFDRAGFQAAVDAEGERRLRQTHQQRGLGSGTVPIRSFAEFFAQEGIQREIRKVLKISDAKRTFKPLTDPAQVEAQVYDPLVKQAVREYASRLGSAPADFAPGGRNGAIGTEAANRVVVPPVALFFSLLGGGGHLLKLLILLTGAITANTAIRSIASITIVGALAVWPMTLPNPVVETRAYGNLDAVAVEFVGARIGERGGRIAAGTLEWTVRTQQVVYPLNEWIRVRLLGGAGFGFSGPGKAGEPADRGERNEPMTARQGAVAHINRHRRDN